ncbi:TrkH family potassium uptake protein [Aedoeadaptatus acetigenes]|uniref:TrkH family potassium uptake protein n=1 Tax=Aedoeadaptatus acetigenes TaxID=2981723 RepID=UPI0011DDEA35|nr:TrkH family potassium uptake protein [Aedoeadaptatus acetigenes]MCU6786916.1 TrkH family potassium uptake protein [Aedoeadaptatus acetigenes]
MNFGAAFNVLGALLMVEGAFLMPPLLYAVCHGEGSTKAFIIAMALALIVGALLFFMPRKEERIRGRDGLFIVAVGWIVASLLGAVPIYLGGGTPNYIDALFETVSGFTTTGASVIPNVEAIDKSIVLWRSMTHWIGGMGILVFTLALLPRVGTNGFRIFKAETPGPVAGKVEPRMKDTAKALYKIYLFITVVLFVLLYFAGMNVFDAVIHTLGVVGTGGFSSHANSCAAYIDNSAILIIMSVFMIICGTNFSLYSRAVGGHWREMFLDEEYRLYLKILGGAVVLIALNLVLSNEMTVGLGLRESLFQVTSIISTSGFASSDYDQWPGFSKCILLALYFFGSCAGSTAGGMKMIRILVLWKIVKREIFKSIHPNAIMPIRINGKIVEDQVIFGIVAFICVYIILLAVSTALTATSGVDFLTAFSGCLTCLSNVGPGFSGVGPTNTFVEFAPGYKLLFSSLMLMGRLEFFTILALFAPQRGHRYMN